MDADRDALTDRLAADVRTPRAEAPAAAAALPVLPGVDARVLIADDNPVNRLVIEGMLAKRGVAADSAEDGRQALERLTHGAYAAVFMDCQMTAHARAGDRERCLQAGMDDYLAKPLRPDELDRVLGRWLQLGPHAAATRALVDEARLRTLRDDYADIAGQLAALFAESTPALLDDITHAHAGGDDDTLRRAAHKLKGSCSNMGATFMATLAGSIEDGDAADDAVEELRAAFAPTREALYATLGNT